MSLIHKLNSAISNPQRLIILVSILAVFGTTQMLLAGIWDATSHTLREPEIFWSIQHITVYAGVAMIAISGIVGSYLLKTKQIDGSLKKGVQIVIIGSIIQIAAGYGDSLSHDVFGIDGLLSLSHQPLEFGLVLSTLGGFLIMKANPNKTIRKFLPVTIATLILSIIWLGFNLILLVGGVILCVPVYEIFSSGCAIL
jgi:hypothetical protein